ncbi:hypothetical protein [Streptomyces termitum]|uniref:hypothetical protein n=1 Tax=Streptomyces termitum TaxID=67368 RepID=UPI0033ADA1D3
MKKPTGRLAVAALTAAATLALTAVPASAVPSTTWTVTPSGGFTAVNRGNVSLFLGGIALTCAKSTASGQTQNATGNPAAIAVITGLSFGSCTSVLGPVSMTPALPWTVVALDHTAATGVTKGYVGNVDANVSVGACTFRVTGRASSTYTNSTGLFSVNSAAGELTVVSSSGCGTVAPVGAKPTFKGDYLVNSGGTPPIVVGTNP